MEAHQHPGQLELPVREMTPARSTPIEKVRDNHSVEVVRVSLLNNKADYKVITNFVLAGLSPRNSLEVLTPEIPGERDRGNCITSLQLHPKGWATLIRCSSNMDDQEVRNMQLQIHLLKLLSLGYLHLFSNLLTLCCFILTDSSSSLGS